MESRSNGNKGRKKEDKIKRKRREGNNGKEKEESNRR